MSKKKVATLLLAAVIAGGLASVFIITKLIEGQAEKHLAFYINQKIRLLIGKDAEIGKLDISLLSRKLILKDVRVSGIDLYDKPADLSADRIEVEVTFSDFEGGFSVVDNLSRAIIKNAAVEYRLDSGKLKIIDKFKLKAVKHTDQIKIEFKGVVSPDSSSKGKVSGDFTVRSYTKPLNFDGLIKVEKLFIPYYYKPFNVSTTDVTNGYLDIVSTFKCHNSWLTASNIVTIDKLEIGTDEKKIFGIKTNMVTDVFNNKVIFDLPMDGFLDNLNFGFDKAMTQILLKELRKKFKSEKLIDKIADKYGKKIGEKIESSVLQIFE